MNHFYDFIHYASFNREIQTIEKCEVPRKSTFYLWIVNIVMDHVMM